MCMNHGLHVQSACPAVSSLEQAEKLKALKERTGLRGPQRTCASISPSCVPARIQSCSKSLPCEGRSPDSWERTGAGTSSFASTPSRGQTPVDAAGLKFPWRASEHIPSTVAGAVPAWRNIAHRLPVSTPVLAQGVTFDARQATKGPRGRQYPCHGNPCVQGNRRGIRLSVSLRSGWLARMNASDRMH
jgi:hypothetical protein